MTHQRSTTPAPDRPEEDQDAAVRPGEPAAWPGRVLALLPVLPALLVVAWLALSLPLLMAGWLRPLPTILLFVPMAALVLWLGLRGRVVELVAGRWAAGGVLAVGLVFLVVQVLMVAEQVMVRRDPASYIQFATWLQEHGSLPIPQDREAFGGGDPVLRYGSPAFYDRGEVLIPQFMAGLPLLLTLGGWIGGTYGMLLMAPLMGACLVMAFGGLVARFVGPKWAPIGSLLLALTLPMVWVSRSTYSELPAMILLFGGLALLHDAGKKDDRRLALLGGLAFGLIVLVRIDGLRDVMPVVVFAGLLIAWRRRIGAPLIAGLLIGATAGLVEGFVLSWPYLAYLRRSIVPLLVICAVLLLATLVMVLVLRWDVTGSRLRRLGSALRNGRGPDAAAVFALLVVAAYAIRPLVQTVRREPANSDDELNVAFIEHVQRLSGLDIDGTRQYSEISLYWVIWYIGLPGLLLATLGAAMLARRLVRGEASAWLLPYAMIAWTTVLVLYSPSITPDHPWASRRLIAVVIPGLLLFAIWGADWTRHRIRRMGYGPRTLRRTTVAMVLLQVVPIAVISGGIIIFRTDQNELAAIRRVCDAIGPDRPVVVVDRSNADRLLQAFRGMCGVPAARTASYATRDDVQRVIAQIYRAGRRPVILGGQSKQVAPYGRPVQVVALRARQDERTLTEPPNGTWSLTLNVWIAEPVPPPE